MTYLTKLLGRLRKTPHIETVPPHAPAQQPSPVDIPPVETPGTPPVTPGT